MSEPVFHHVYGSLVITFEDGFSRGEGTGEPAPRGRDALCPFAWPARVSVLRKLGAPADPLGVSGVLVKEYSDQLRTEALTFPSPRAV